MKTFLSFIGIWIAPCALACHLVDGDRILAGDHTAGSPAFGALRPPFAQAGTKIDFTAAAIGEAKTLQGGVLLLTPLKGADGQVYAVAQGAVITGGFVRVVAFVSEIENLTVEPDKSATVAIDERTGTIVIGKDLKISPVAIMHGSMAVEIRPELEVSQPEPAPAGATFVTT